ncbi:oligopeptide ABC transporter permease [Candidatus Margulisiibacteriota bacterium]
MISVLRRFKRNKLAVLGALFLIFMVFVAILSPLFSPYDPNEIVSSMIVGPSAGHLFGTDDIGRDIFSRILYGARISLSIGFVAVSIAIIIGIIIGSISGYFGGFIDNTIMRFVDIMLAFPTIFLVLTIQSILTPNIYNVMAVIGITSWMGVARLVRSEFLSLKEREFVEAARAIGASNGRIIFRHILPNALSPVIVAATLGMAGAILTESALSFLGLGVQPPQASWGSMLMDAQAYMFDAPWMAIIPGLFILFSVLSLYFVGDGLREALNPKE